MRNILTIGGREFKSYLTSPIAYIVTAFFLVWTWFFFILFANTAAVTVGETSMGGVFNNMFYDIVIIILMTLLTMRAIAEERKLGTIELLMTAPVRDSELVIGKFVGAVGMMLVMLAFTAYFPIMLFVYGDPDPGPIFASYLGIFLLCSCSLAAGLFASSLTSNQILAAVIGGGIMLGLWFLGSVATTLPTAAGTVVAYFSPSGYIPQFVRGIVDTRGIVYFLSAIVLFLFLAMRSLENSRWNS